ncbi:hypothetical protein TEA_017196 [Camellia sinensis var. sinensis]|uniref:Uncharacterized protein n=1 Tax=Camellia sinensis var. sinensis TaxID=542762 RepID=A0A4S4EPH2_CAMSN|nr:hypothetical protein TEA_017196 [Camellia sinensis var. sinensis]
MAQSHGHSSKYRPIRYVSADTYRKNGVPRRIQADIPLRLKIAGVSAKSRYVSVCKRYTSRYTSRDGPILTGSDRIPAATSMANNATDRAALEAFKAAVVQDPFGALTSWNHSLHYCHWNGILCSRRHPDRVIRITLRSQGLVGSLSPHVGNLSFLKSVVLQNNSFHDPIPQEMGRLFRLQTIEFSNNSFGGGIPNNLSRCLKLEWLNLIDNNLTGNIPAELGTLSRLGTLALGTNKLSVADNQLEGNIPPDIGSTLPNLKFLYLFTTLFTGTLPTSLSNASELESIDFSQNDFSRTMPTNLGKLLGLGFINVYQNRLQDDLAFISSLTNCTSLQDIQVGSNLFRGSLPDSIANLSTYLNLINLQINQIHGIIPSGIGNLLNLTVLSMAENNLAGPIPSSIGRLQNLQYLFLGHKKFTELPSSLGNLTSLISLALEGNKIHGSIPPSLGNCHSLLELALFQNNLHGSIPPEIMSLNSISKFLWTHTKHAEQLFEFGMASLGGQFI